MKQVWPTGRENSLSNFLKSRAERMDADPTNNTLMNWNAFSQMSEADLGALYDFFMTLPPVPYSEEPI